MGAPETWSVDRSGSIPASLVLPNLLRERAACTPDSVFIEEVDGSTTTFAELDDQVRRWTTILRDGGASDGAVVAVLNAGKADTIRTWMASAWCGAVEVAINSGYQREMLLYVLSDAGATVVVASVDDLDVVRWLAPQLPALTTVVVPGASRGQVEVPGLRVVVGPDLEEAEPAADAANDERPAYHATASIIYTSGTSGPSKGVVVPWGKFYREALIGGLAEDLDANDAFYSVLPMFHISGKQSVYMAALAGARLVLREAFSATHFLDDVRRHGCTITCLAVALANFLLAQPERSDDHASPLRRVLLAPVPKDLEGFRRRFGVDVMTFYGQTESSLPLLSAWNPAKPGSLGRPRPEYEVVVANEHDEPLPSGEIGELLLRPRHPWMMMTSYLGRPEATLEAWRNGWFHTGDAVRYDDDGDYFFVDRRKDTIRRRGENISSVELEAMVAAHPEVQECAAVAVPSEWGEDEIVLFVTSPSGAQPAGDLLGQVNDLLPSYMQVSRLELAGELPRTATGKVAKGELRARALDLDLA